MALSPKQLRLVFAKLRAKGLLNYLKKGRPLQQMAMKGSSKMRSPFSKKVLDSIFSEDIAQRYISRLPQNHQKLAADQVRTIKVWDKVLLDDPRFSEAAGMLDSGGDFSPPGTLHVLRNPASYMSPAGYSNLPLHVPRGIAALREAWGAKVSAATLSRGRIRNAKIGAAKAFYHEYGHGMFNRMELWQHGEWMKIGYSKEWTTSIRGSFGSVRDSVPLMESFPDAYAAYATSKVSRTRLKRERPLTFEYMKKFFEEK